MLLDYSIGENCRDKVFCRLVSHRPSGGLLLAPSVSLVALENEMNNVYNLHRTYRFHEGMEG
jgi:hypothetical protein